MRPGNMGSMANKLKHKRCSNSPFYTNIQFRSKSYMRNSLPLKEEPVPERNNMGLKIYQFMKHIQSRLKSYVRDRSYMRDKRTSPRKKKHGPQNLPVHETHTEQVEKLHKRQELHERQLTIERRTSLRKKHHGPQNSLVHETYTKKVGKLHERQVHHYYMRDS
ncbi:hypothetical protein Dimus_029243 [Dionaea muscipula]